MARLGKRERNAKRDTIKANLSNLASLERSSGTMRSSLDAKAIMRRTHTMGAHVGSNIKGSINTSGGPKRWGRD